MGHELVGLFGGGVEAERVIDIVMHRERHGGVGAVNAGAAGVDQVLHAIVAAALQDVAKANEVAIDVRERVFKGVTHAGLRCQVNHTLGFMALKQFGHTGAVDHVHADMDVVGVISLPSEPGFFQSWIVIIVMVVDADNGVAAFKQAQC